MGLWAFGMSSRHRNDYQSALKCWLWFKCRELEGQDWRWGKNQEAVEEDQVVPGAGLPKELER